jgi:TubC N-terminal docking domain
MTAAALVETLRARGVTLKRRGEKLRVVPASAVTPDEVAALRRVKPEVLRHRRTRVSYAHRV